MDNKVIMAKDVIYAELVQEIMSNKPDFETPKPYSGWLPTETIIKTYGCTAQLAKIPMSMVLKMHYKTPFPASNVHCCNKPIVTSTVYADTLAIDAGLHVLDSLLGLHLLSLMFMI